MRHSGLEKAPSTFAKHWWNNVGELAKPCGSTFQVYWVFLNLNANLYWQSGCSGMDQKPLETSRAE
uniref:Uncharacterized protein n=1 Tax=Anguilla anguilla TaxID=7936 RepID=A0A0E9WLG2_ANGAN